IGHILNNANRIEQDAKMLAENDRFDGGSILRLFVEEEAAKVLILMDAVRCPRDNKRLFSRQLGYFNDHLAKRIYAQACYSSPATFGELKDFVESHRQKFYLDGPNDVDWIFPNWLTSSREQTIYVDYVDTGEGHIWLKPIENSAIVPNDPLELRLAKALVDSGFTSPEALSLIADIWRQTSMCPEFPWTKLRDLNKKTLDEMQVKNLLHDQSLEVHETIAESWLFPMYSLDLKLPR
ncbi:MAG: AbiV family abortive infection protein, partial [Chloroflexi bacterium]|nr:AbiV family abortive infection protein [Chloroflexota bacterium]